MGRTNYGSIGGRRSSTAIWQWTIMGIVLGLGCSAVVVLSLLTFGILAIDSDGLSSANQATQTPVIVTATTDPNLVLTPTQTPIIVTATLDPNEAQTVDDTTTELTEEEPDDAVIVQATATDVPPSPDPAEQITETPTPEPTVDTSTTDSGGVTTQGSDVPLLLQGQLSALVAVSGGTFSMGTNQQELAIAANLCVSRDGGACDVSFGEDSVPLHQVTIDQFWMERTEVSLNQYVAFLNSQGPGSHSNGCFGELCIVTQSENQFSNILFDGANYTVAPVFANLPAAGVSWWGAQAYCQAIGRRLPTEAEWERAARGQNNTIYPWGEEWIGDGRAYVRIPNQEGTEGPGEVGSQPGNLSGFQVLDMAGNVAEWVYDYYDATYYQTNTNNLNPQGPSFGTDRVLRGGSWDTPPFFARSVHRQNQPPNSTFLWIGFRCASDTDGSTTLPTNTGNVGTIPTTNEDATGDDDINAAPELAPVPTSVGEPSAVPDVPPGG